MAGTRWAAARCAMPWLMSNAVSEVNCGGGLAAAFAGDFEGAEHSESLQSVGLHAQVGRVGEEELQAVVGSMRVVEETGACVSQDAPMISEVPQTSRPGSPLRLDPKRDDDGRDPRQKDPC